MWTIGWSQPCAFASAAFSRVPTVPTTVAPRCFSHWQAISPHPPAAAWKRTVSPGRTACVRRIRYCTVQPLSMTAAACSSLIPSGSFTSRFDATIRRWA